MVDLYKEIDFTEELGNVPELESYLKTKAKEVQDELPSDYIKKPFLDRSFDEFLIIAGLPIAEAAKVENFRTFFKAKILSQLDILDTIEKIEF